MLQKEKKIMQWVQKRNLIGTGVATRLRTYFYNINSFKKMKKKKLFLMILLPGLFYF